MTGHSVNELGDAVASARTAMVGLFRSPLLVRQQRTSEDRPVRGPRWVSRTVFPAPVEDEARRILVSVIKELGGSSDPFPLPGLADVPVEWVGHRPGVPQDAPEPVLTERAKFESLVADAKSDITMVYMYGGAHCMNAPVTRRNIAARLSRLTGARCVIIQPRLAPQHAFPSQQLDLLHVYLSLTCPHTAAFHAPVDPAKIVLTGDSSGAQLALSLIQVILSIHRSNPGDIPWVRFHGQDASLMLPAGVAMQSPGVDMLGSCLPSWQSHKATDIFQDVSLTDVPADAVWPTDPPRLHLVTQPPLLVHPLLSPITAGDWTGAPPMYIAVGGGEMCLDAARVVAQRAARDGVPVIYEEYDLMPHNWPMILRGWQQGDRCLESWASAMVKFTHGTKVETNGRAWAFQAASDGELVSRSIEVRHLTEWSTEDVKSMAREALAQYIARTKARMGQAGMKL